MDKVSRAADLSRELRKALGGITQAELAAKLLLSRNYISQIEAALKTPSQRVLSQMTQLLAESASDAEEVSKRSASFSAPHALKNPAEALRVAIRTQIESAIAAAGDDFGRLGWLLEEIRSIQPEHWRSERNQLTPDHERAIREVLREEHVGKRKSG